MTKTEMGQRLEELEAENKTLRKMVAEYEADDCYEDDDEAKINRIVAEKLAEEDRLNDERAANDPDFAYELRCIRYLESRYDDDYGF